MAQASSFNAPPGLEGNASVLKAANEVRAHALQHLEEQLSQLGPHANRTQIVEAVKEAVIQEVDQRFSAATEKLWKRGKQVMMKLEQKHREETMQLTEELSKYTEKQRACEEEQERLKQVLQQLASHITMFGNNFNHKNLQSPGAESSTVAGHSPQAATEGSSPGPFSPGSAAFVGLLSDMTGSVLRSELESAAKGKLPDVPAFPSFTQAPMAAPLSLVEALGTQTPKRTPLSLASTLAASEGSAFGRSAGTGTFSFTIRKADGADLGLNVSHNTTEPVLKVEGVRADGAVEAWNKQCAGGLSQEKIVIAGDRIISVNATSFDPEKMLEECKEKQLLKLTIVRADTPVPPIPGHNAALKTTSLRAEASVFVPSGSKAEVAENPVFEMQM